MRKYKISIQFAAPDAPDFDDVIMAEIEKAISNYNVKSMTARTPKRIAEKVVVNPRTLQLTLESRSELPFPSRSLRLFSTYLIAPETGALRKYLYGKQIFRMISSEEAEASKPEPETAPDEGINALKLKAISRIMNASEGTLRDVIDLLGGGRK